VDLAGLSVSGEGGMGCIPVAGEGRVSAPTFVALFGGRDSSEKKGAPGVWLRATVTCVLRSSSTSRVRRGSESGGWKCMDEVECSGGCGGGEFAWFLTKTSVRHPSRPNRWCAITGGAPKRPTHPQR
jgi:hypothetical protein